MCHVEGDLWFPVPLTGKRDTICDIETKVNIRPTVNALIDLWSFFTFTIFTL